MSSLLFLYRVCLERCTYPKTNICSPKLCKLAPPNKCFTKQMFYVPQKTFFCFFCWWGTISKSIKGGANARFTSL